MDQNDKLNFVKESLDKIDKIKLDYLKAFSVISKEQVSGSYTAVAIISAMQDLSPAEILTWCYQFRLTADIVLQDHPDKLDEINREANRLSARLLGMDNNEPDLDIWKIIGVDTSRYK